MYPALADVKCIVVDKYQGEENDIILLSLVRSNADAKIGFLKTENRVCVALSRAKKGLYVVGNMENLRASGPLWQEIHRILQADGSSGKCEDRVKYVYLRIWKYLSYLYEMSKAKEKLFLTEYALN